MSNSGRGLVHKQVNTLVIIDMQDTFLWPIETYKPVISHVIREIRLAKRRGDHILVVEFETVLSNSGFIYDTVGCKSAPTHADLKKAIGTYNKACFVFKRMVNGGREVHQTLLEKNIPHTNVRICGVYADACVRETVVDLSKRIPKSQIHLVKNGIATCGNNIDNREHAIKDMTFFENIKVLA